MNQKKRIAADLKKELGKYLKLNGIKEDDLTEGDWENVRFNLGWTLTRPVAHTAKA